MSEHIRSAGQAVTPDEQVDRVMSNFDCIKIIRLSNQDIGMIKVVREQSNWRLIQIQLIPAFQKTGVGSKIISKVLADAAHNSASVSLSVLKGNPAKRLYDRLGFNVTAENGHSFAMQIDA